MSKILHFITLMILVIGCTSCDNAGRNAKLIWDSGPAQELYHSGKFKGYVRVYTINWIDDTYSMSSENYKVYKKSSGDYIIDYDGDDYILQKAETPYDVGVYSLKWKIDYNHYIEDIPTSY